MSLTAKTQQWLAKNARSSLAGKTVLITGANSGVGFKMAETMVYLGASVILACRNPQRATEAKETLMRDYPNASVSTMHLDLADFSSIEAFVEELRNGAVDIDVFVNNAGAFRQPGKKTVQGFDLVIGTNYFGVYYLTKHLLPYLEGLPHRVWYINTVSIAYKIARMDYDDFYCAEEYKTMEVYGRSKLCLARYSYALAKQYEGTNIHVLMSHPGMCMTPMGVNAFGLSMDDPKIRRHARLLNSPEKSSLSLAYILSHDVPAGAIIGLTKGFGGWGYPKQNHVYRKAKTGAEELLRFTEQEIAQRWPS